MFEDFSAPCLNNLLIHCSTQIVPGMWFSMQQAAVRLVETQRYPARSCWIFTSKEVACRVLSNQHLVDAWQRWKWQKIRLWINHIPQRSGHNSVFKLAYGGSIMRLFFYMLLKQKYLNRWESYRNYTWQICLGVKTKNWQFSLFLA